MPSHVVDWVALAHQLGVVSQQGESSSLSDYRRALELLVGEDVIRSAVDHYVSGGEGSELVAGVLSQLRPRSAMNRCYEIFRSQADIDTRRAAVDLMRMTADRSALTWIPEFLADPDPGVQNWGMEVVEHLLWTGTIDPSECEPLLYRYASHDNLHVRQVVNRARRVLQQRREQV